MVIGLLRNLGQTSKLKASAYTEDSADEPIYANLLRTKATEVKKLRRAGKAESSRDRESYYAKDYAIFVVR